ncbi:TonB-dependent receptor [Danxiaibacter flavus]|uniref:TonB-dependent receptor n=1 Tax=Danxiaibacter flavus TaxID=3049108 RepID=A0ABV3ZK50_9BACT|nr:TonB-dependent receptor [Chitinophagaceae bacterium DXS]
MRNIRLIPLIVLLLSFTQLSAQALRLSGKVVDEENGSPVVGASIVVTETKKGVRTDVEGRFFINIEQGKNYTLTVSSIGYASKAINEISQDNIKSGTLGDILLKRSNNQLQAVVVTSSARKETAASLYLAQKNSSSISDGISSEIIKRSPDKSTGEVLKRVSGASVQDNKFVVIRGLNERYNVALLNNSILPSTEPDKKAFSFDIIPSSLIDNLVIYKSPLPDLPGDFSGGAIKITTKDYPAKPISELSVSIGFNSLTTFKNFYNSYPKGSLDWLGFFDDSRLMPGSYYRHRGASFINLPNDQKNAITKQFPNTFGTEAAYQSLPNFGFSYTGGNTKILKENKKLGYIYAISYNEGRRVSDRVRTDYQTQADQDYTYQYNTNNYDVRNNLSALLNVTYAYGRSKISLKNLFNNDFVKTAGIREGVNKLNFDPFYIKSNNSEATGNGIVNSSLEGTHSLNSGWTVDWNGSFGYTYRWQPDQRILAFRSPEGIKDNYYLSLSNENSPEIRNAGRVYSYLQEYIYGANVNVTKQFRWLGQTQKLKMGSANYYRDRNVEVDALGYAGFTTNVKINETKETTFNNIFSPENIEKYNLTVANIGTNSTDYNAHALLNAGYIMLDNKFSDRVKLTWGARVENYSQKLIALNKADVNVSNLDVLPSFLFTFALNNKSNLRLAASEAVNRPEFRELASYSVYDYDNNLSITGNPNLVRSKNTNADLRYEWFPSAGDIVSISAFYKYFDKPIEQTNQGNDVLSYANANNAYIYGTELELRKKLDFFGSSILDHFTFYANAAYIRGSVKFSTMTVNSPLQGQSPYLVNGGITYSTKNDDFVVNALYNRIGPRLRFRAVSDAGKNIFEKPRDVIDLQLTKKFYGSKLEIKLTVSDLLAQANQWYYKFESGTSNTGYNPSTDKIIYAYKYGTTSTLAIRYNFGR